MLIAAAGLLSALLIAGKPSWPGTGFGPVAGITIVAGIAYTVFSEWLITSVRGSWTYTDATPVLPLLGVGLTPVLQWLIVPSIAFWFVRDQARCPLAKSSTTNAPTPSKI
ncbi:MAG: hypothetical protein JNM79_25305 [Burkholderiales bacterium]|nr:hypothetical protein [Burkholderiales bacterium]